MKDAPPNGVIAPIHLKLLVPMKDKSVSRYRDPQKKTIPKMNSIPAFFSILFGQVLYNMAAKANANTW